MRDFLLTRLGETGKFDIIKGVCENVQILSAPSLEEGKANWKVNKWSELVVALFNVRQAQGYKKVKVKL